MSNEFRICTFTKGSISKGLVGLDFSGFPNEIAEQWLRYRTNPTDIEHAGDKAAMQEFVLVRLDQKTKKKDYSRDAKRIIQRAN